MTAVEWPPSFLDGSEAGDYRITMIALLLGLSGAASAQPVEGHQELQELPPQVQAEVFNGQERINTVLVRAHEDSRQSCQYTRATDSNMPRGRCLTVAKRRRIEEEGEALLHDQRTFTDLSPPGNR